jgi:tetratricopeptide (TPR) repeat protein
VGNYPESDTAIWAQQRSIFACIALRDDPNTEAGIDALFARFSSHKDIASAVYGTARKLNNKNNVKAEELYQYVVDNHPDHKYVPFAHANIGNIKLWEGDKAAAQAVFARVQTDFAEHPLLPKAIAIIGDGYYTQALHKACQGLRSEAEWNYGKAIQQFERVVTQFPKIPFTTAEAHFFAALCHQRLGRYTEALDHYQQVVDDWPEYEDAWKAQFRIAKIYKWSALTGPMGKEEALTKVGAAFERLVEYYPDCPAAECARTWLQHSTKPIVGGQK